MMGGSTKKSKAEKGEKAAKKKPKDNANVIFVGGLRKTTEEDRVTAHFAKFGQVEQVDIKRLPDGTSRGFAFVKFSDTEAVEKVIDAHAKHMIDNKWVEVKRHDGVAASAGLTSSLQKAEEPEEEAEPQGEEWSEKWSEQYLAMASKLGEMQKDGDKEGGGGEKKSKSPMEKLMKQMGMDPAVMKQMGMDPKQMEGMFKQMGIDPSMMMQMMGNMNPMMGMMGMMNPMMMGGGMGCGMGGGMGCGNACGGNACGGSSGCTGPGRGRGHFVKEAADGPGNYWFNMVALVVLALVVQVGAVAALAADAEGLAGHRVEARTAGEQDKQDIGQGMS
ncbi:RNA-binding protein squid (Heterogeneous nuclear ribonucleoprotein 40) (HNRNP 40) [Durusdinium trenchii]|uniref:RNA-binding protein squid (Heterogeneous nuclear ribonucleoprotein 40) (HNRNP 40) n=1 Tax=Durusdinium trenchii TaxID=1381693 RepID=A0ABP0QU21_9DINO